MKIKFQLLIILILVYNSTYQAWADNNKTTMTKTIKFKKKSLHLQDKYHNLKIVDIPKVNIDSPQDSIIDITLKSGKVNTFKCDILIVGASLGGIAASISSASNMTKKKSGLKRPKIILVEETPILGGQITAQGVSALDENYLVETSGASLNYQNLRKYIRDYYKTKTSLIPEKQIDNILNPGNSWVTRLSFEPKVGLMAIEYLLKPYLEKNIINYRINSKSIYARKASGKICFYTDHYIGNTNNSQNKIKGIGFFDVSNGQIFEIQAKKIIDATELGDLLNLTEIPYVSGAESKDQTGEADAQTSADTENTQDFTYPFVVEFIENGNFVIKKPDCFEKFKDKYSFLNYKMFEKVNINTGNELLPFWEYRRLIDKKYFNDTDTYTHDLSMINWESNDLRHANIIDQKPEVIAKRLAMGKCLSLGFLYWLQTHASRDDGGVGYPELKLRKDILNTSDGLSAYPYIRESRRIKAKDTIVESDISAKYNSSPRAKLFSNSIGIGLYPIDIHGEKPANPISSETKPFQIPIGSLIPVNGGNILAGCKNIGTTHITNGSYRLHPVEWAIGEAAGVLAIHSLKWRKSFSQIYKDDSLVLKIQENLINNRSPICWFDDVGTDNNYFKYIQFLAINNIVNLSKTSDLSFNGFSEPSIGEALPLIARSYAFKKYSQKFKQNFRLKLAPIYQNTLTDENPDNCLKYLIEAGILDPKIKYDLTEKLNNKLLNTIINDKNLSENINRFELAKWLYKYIKQKSGLNLCNF